MAADLVITHLYPDLLRTYGDRGNVLALVRRAEWRGFRVRVESVSLGERLPSATRLVLIGGGTDRAQTIIGEDLLGRTRELGDLLDHGAVLIGICGGYQLLGHLYVAVDGTEIPGLGLLDVRTVGGEGRMIGRVRAQASLGEDTFELYGFENHAGRTHLGERAAPLASVPLGQGNNGDDRTEGAVQGRIVGTYLHGPVLPGNPHFADALLRQALHGVTGGAPLESLDDGLERAARREARLRRR